MMTARISDENIVTVLNVGSLALLILMAVGGALFFSGQFAFGVLAGGVLAIVNFNWLCNTMKRAVHLAPETAKRFALIRYLFRITILALIIWALIVKAKADPLGMLIGLSVLIINIYILSIFRLKQKGG